ncbi:universal stress protein [soil metagenome]
MTETLLIQDIPRGSVLVGVDGSDGSNGALDWAADEAARQHRTLVVVHTESPVTPWNASGYPSAVVYAPDLRDAVLAGGKAITAAAHERAVARQADLEVIEANDTIDPRLGLVEASRHAHVLVVGSRGRGPLASMLMGSVSVAVSRDTVCPVVVVRPGDAAGSHVLALVDGTAASIPVIEFAARHASELGQPLRITHLLWPVYDVDLQLVEGATRMLAETSAGLGEKFPDVVVTTEVANTAGPEELLATATEASFVVVGHQSSNRLHQFLYRSVSSAVLEHATVPVAVVPTPAD